MLATKESPIMIAQNKPKVEKKPIFDWLITMNPAMSEIAEPNRANPDAPPTAAIDTSGEEPSSRSSRYLSAVHDMSMPTPRDIAAMATVTIFSPYPAREITEQPHDDNQNRSSSDCSDRMVNPIVRERDCKDGQYDPI